MADKYDTLKYYNDNAQTYFEQTKNLELAKLYDRFLKHLPSDAYILDFGCGSGRDSKYFLDKGYRVDAIDGSTEMCKLASEYIKQEVICKDFEELNEANKYDGIWACSSILHIEKENLPNILIKMINTLKVDGVIYISFKLGTGSKVIEGRYFNYMTMEEIIDLINSVSKNVEVIDHFESLPTLERNMPGIIWENIIVKKIDGDRK